MIAEQREARKAERARKAAESRTEKERIVAEAEQLAEGSDWRNGANRLRELLDKWKALPRIDRASDDALWRRFSAPGRRTPGGARRTSPSSRRSATGPSASRSGWPRRPRRSPRPPTGAPTAGAYRDLMREWKAAGPAPRDVDDALWKRFRGAQDTFFGARDAANAELDEEFAANAEVKEAAARRGRGAGARSPTSRPPSGRSATSPSAGTPPARSRATG